MRKTKSYRIVLLFVFHFLDALKIKASKSTQSTVGYLGRFRKKPKTLKFARKQGFNHTSQGKEKVVNVN